MKRLLLLRHAKAVAGGSKSGDHGRALTDRGRSDAAKIGIAMQHKRYLPGLVLCSTSERTVETWRHVGAELDLVPPVEFLDELYLASAKTIANSVRAVREPAEAVLVIGHNPGLEECARALVGKPRSDAERKHLEAIAEKFPTSALAVIAFEVQDWSAVAAGGGVLSDFLRPKDLTDQ
jgi:phosphohistidine phosphatase